MKKFAGTWLFGLLVICLSAYVLLDFSNQVERGGLEEGEIQFFQDFDRSRIVAIEIKKSKEITKIQFKDNNCEIVEPIMDRCDSIAIEGLFSQIDVLKGKKIEGPINTGEMGLDGDLGTQILLHTIDNKTQLLSIGEKNSFDGGLYVRWNNEYYITAPTTSQLTNKTAKQYRDHRIWRGENDFDQIQVRVDLDGAREKYTLTKSNEEWSSVEADGRSVSSAKVNRWIEALKELRATEISDDKSSMLNIPRSAEIVFSKSGDVQYELDWVKGSFLDSKTNRVLKVPEGLAKKTLVPLYYFFDGSAPFRFPLETATQLILTKNGGKEILKKSDSDWKIEGDQKTLSAESLPDFFSALNKLEAIVYYKPQKWFGLEERDKKRLQILGAEKTLLDLTWGGKIKINQGPFKDQEIRYVQVSGQKYVLGVLAKQFDDFINLSFLAHPHKEESPHDHVH